MQITENKVKLYILWLQEQYVNSFSSALYNMSNYSL